MTKQKKYTFIGIISLLVIIIGYHFYAAYQAEKQIDTAIQEQTAKTNTVSVQYSSIDVAPFSGQVSFNDLTVILGNHIERAQELQFNTSYLDFLNIYVGGLEYGLNHLNRALITLTRPSYVNQSTRGEIKADSLNITYSGNALDGLRSAINGTPFKSTQEIDARSTGLIMQFPNTTFFKLVANQFNYSGSIAAGERNYWTDGSHQFAMNSLTWTPSDSFQKTYSFFIKGFGYETEAIPFQSAHLNYEPSSQAGNIHIESTVKSELALVSAAGNIQLQKPFSQSELQDIDISITEFSKKFSQVIHNMQTLLSIPINPDEQGITLTLTGTVANPRLAK